MTEKMQEVTRSVPPGGAFQGGSLQGLLQRWESQQAGLFKVLKMKKIKLGLAICAETVYNKERLMERKDFLLVKKQVNRKWQKNAVMTARTARAIAPPGRRKVCWCPPTRSAVSSILLA